MHLFLSFLAFLVAARHASYTPGVVPTGNRVICQWCMPANLHSYVVPYDAGSIYPYGQCTYYAAYKAGLGATGLGNAGQWASQGTSRGYTVTSTVRAGSVAVFAAGTQGAGKLGHVGWVEEVYSNGWFLLSEANYQWNGGGLGRVDFRYAQPGPGVQFLTP